MARAEPFGEEFGLSAFSDPRSAEEDQPPGAWRRWRHGGALHGGTLEPGGTIGFLRHRCGAVVSDDMGRERREFNPVSGFPSSREHPSD